MHENEKRVINNKHIKINIFTLRLCPFHLIPSLPIRDNSLEMAFRTRYPVGFLLPRYNHTLCQLRVVTTCDIFIPRVHYTKPLSHGNWGLWRDITPFSAKGVLTANPPRIILLIRINLAKGVNLITFT